MENTMFQLKLNTVPKVYNFMYWDGDERANNYCFVNDSSISDDTLDTIGQSYQTEYAEGLTEDDYLTYYKEHGVVLTEIIPTIIHI